MSDQIDQLCSEPEMVESSSESLLKTECVKDDARGGNTKLPRASRCSKWFLTISKESSKYDCLTWKLKLDNEDCLYAFQEEVGEGGFEHLQCCIKFKWGKTFEYVRALSRKSHIEVCKNWNRAVEYCTKEETRKPGTLPTTNIPGLSFVSERDILEHSRFGWWNHLYTALRGPPSLRKILWFKGDGDDGKTYFIRQYLKCHKDAIMVTGSAKDMQYAIAQCEVKPKVVFMNLSKSLEGRISYQGIEAIKDGLFFSAKYESGMVVMDNPHVVVMANFLPDFGALARNRWTVYELFHKDEYVYELEYEGDEEIDEAYPDV